MLCHGGSRESALLLQRWSSSRKLPLPHPGGAVARRRCCSRGIAITPADGRARVLAGETNRPVEAIVAAQLKPDGDRSRLLSRRSRAGTDAAVHRHAVPRTDVTVLDQRLPLRLANQLPRRRELRRCRNSSEPTARTGRAVTSALRRVVLARRVTPGKRLRRGGRSGVLVGRASREQIGPVSAALA